MSIKIRSSWIDSNTYSLGVRVYRKLEVFTIDTLPNVYATIPKGTTSYEDTNVEEGQTYFYMLGVFNNGQEVFTECYEVYVEPPSPYTTVAYVGSITTDVDRVNAYRQLVESLGYKFTTYEWNYVFQIPSSDCKLIIASEMSTDKDGFYVTQLNVISNLYNSGVPLLVSTVSSVANTLPQTYPSILGFGSKFLDITNADKINIKDNSILSTPYNSNTDNLVVRQSSYYMAKLDGAPATTNVIARHSDGGIVASILTKGSINTKGVAAPANLAFCGFAYIGNSTKILNPTGLDLLKQIIQKTVR